MTISHDPDDFKELGRERRPVCDHADRCKAIPSRDVVLCFRQDEPEINGFRKIKYTNGCTTYVRSGSDADRNGRPKRESKRAPWGKPILAPTAVVDKLAEELCVSVDSLRALELHVRDVPHVGRCACFPERDGDGRIVGWNSLASALNLPDKYARPHHQYRRLGPRLCQEH